MRTAYNTQQPVYNISIKTTKIPIIDLNEWIEYLNC